MTKGLASLHEMLMPSTSIPCYIACMFSKIIDSTIGVSKNTMQCLRLEMKIQPFDLESRVLTLYKWF